MNKIIPAILTNEPIKLQQKLKRLKNITNLVQIDLMDGRFVDNESIELNTLGLYKDFEYELHLMVEEPQNYLKEISNLKIKSFVFHIETNINHKDLISKLREKNINVGVALNPETNVKLLDPFLDLIDFVLVLGVNPGFSGSKFQDEVLDKIVYLKTKNIKVEVDGGINLENIEKIKKAGADRFAIGSGLFEAQDINSRFKKLNSKIN